jgi:diketogulonate reductase-like aldo/keto reductase
LLLLVGARKLRHFEENVGAVDIKLSQEHINYIDKLSLEFQNKHLLQRLELWMGSCLQEGLDKFGLKKPW